MTFPKFLVLSLFLSSCASPTAAIRPDIETFKKDHPDKIQTYVSGNRTMGYAWNGDNTKRAIVFVHGSPGSWEGWAHFLLDPELQKNFQLIAIDRPGFGASEPGKTETSLAKQARNIIEVLQFNKSKKPAIFVGHSFGGPVIARIAMDFPDQVAGLVFVASSVSPDLESNKWYQTPATWWPLRVLIPTPLRVCNEEILPLKNELKLMLPKWKSITAKSVLIQGDADDLVPPGNLDFLIENLNPKLVLKVIKVPGLNHFVPWKRPDLIMEAINDVNQGL